MADNHHRVAGHYTSGRLWQRLEERLRADGLDPGRVDVDSLAPYDQFHGRGLEATVEVAASLAATPTDHLLDVGSGLGGPARFMATRTGCRVTGIDLTAELCHVAGRLNVATGLAGRVQIAQGSALDLPFRGGTFDAAYSMNVAMNIGDKAGLYREVRRVLRPGGRLVLSEVARGPHGEVEYPTPWAATASASFLATPDDTRRLLEEAGFEVTHLVDTTAAALDYGARSRQIVEQGGQPPHRAISLVHGDLADTAAANSGRATREGAIVPIEVRAVRRD